MRTYRYEDFFAWTVFWKIVKTGNLTEAANGLGLAPAAVSRLIKDLEASVGEPLLDRSKRPLRTTFRGEQLFDQIGSLITEFQRFVVRNFDESIYKGTPYVRSVRVSSLQGHAHEFLAPLLAEYIRLDSKAFFCLYIEKGLSDLSAKAVDVIVSASSHTREEFRRFEVRKIPCPIFCSPEYLTKHGEPKRVQDLASHTVLSRVGINFPESRHVLYRGSERADVSFGQEVFTDNSVVLRQSAIQGSGIVLDLPAEFVAEAVKKGQLRQILRGWHRKPFERAVLIRQSDYDEGNAIRRFAEWLTEREREESLKRELCAFMTLGEQPRDYL